MNVKEYSIIPDTDTNSNRSKCDDDFIIYNMKLTDELMEKLTRGQVDLNNLQEIDFIHTEKGVDLLKIGMETFPFMKVKETQPIHLLSNYSESSSKLHLVGPVTHKLNPKLELEAGKAEVIRQRSQDAEKERLSRKTVELDILPQGKGQKRLIKRVTNTPRGITSSVNGSTTLSKVHINANAKSNSNSGIPLRTRIIQVLAIGPISLDQLIFKLNVNCPADGLNPFLNELCVGGSSDLRSLRLKPERFEEVKVTDWPHYNMRERDLVARNRTENQIPIVTATPPETPETPSPKKQSVSSTARSSAVSSVPSSAKKATSAKDRLNALMKRRK